MFAFSNFIDIFIVLVVYFVSDISCQVDYCADNQFVQSRCNSKLQFTKELRQKEFSVQSKFKSLHCCSKGYRSIEWFKDGIPYPWSSDISSFILYPESANQTIYSHTLKISDTGNYTCLVRNNTRQLFHETQLLVFESEDFYNVDNPLVTYKPSNISFAIFGQQSRLFCEAFIGNNDTKYGKNEAFWKKIDRNTTLGSYKVHSYTSERDENRIIGSYLIINNVNSSDLGTYVCTIRNSINREIHIRTQLQALHEMSYNNCYGREIIFLVMLWILFLVLFITYIKRKDFQEKYLKFLFGNIINGFYKNLKMKQPDGFTAVYAEEDTEMAKVLLKSLLNQYYITEKVINPKETLSDKEMLESNFETAIILLSPNLIQNWNATEIGCFLKKFFVEGYNQYVIYTEELPHLLDKAFYNNSVFVKLSDANNLLKVLNKNKDKSRCKYIYWKQTQTPYDV